MRCIERWLKLVTQTTKVTKQPVLNLPQQSAGSNDFGVFVCAFIEYAGLIINWDELHEKSQRSENNRKAIRERIEFFRVDREPNKKWYDSSFKMAEWIKKEEPKQVKQEAK
jgi:Ulp1 family protease